MVWAHGLLLPMVLSYGIACDEAFIRLEEAPLYSGLEVSGGQLTWPSLARLAKVMKIFIGAGFSPHRVFEDKIYVSNVQLLMLIISLKLLYYAR